MDSTINIRIVGEEEYGTATKPTDPGGTPDIQNPENQKIKNTAIRNYLAFQVKKCCIYG